MAFQSGGAFLPGADYQLGTLQFTGALTNGVGQVLDSQSVNRLLINPTEKTIANGSATALFNVARGLNTYEGGIFFYEVFATDGTDYQTISGLVTYSMVDKAGTGTFAITEAGGNVAKAVSTGTYTLSWTFVTGTNIGTVKLTPTTSLTATTHVVRYTVMPHKGTVTIL